MLTAKLVVFSALVVALAVNIEEHRAAWSVPPASQEAHHENDPSSCALDPGWECKNTMKWHACKGDEGCIIFFGVAI